MSRLAKLTAANPNATIDMTIIEGIKDSVMHRGGVVSCDTRTIEEYRYEGEIFTTDILAWYTIVIALRGAAQT
uniref:Uncharacterized protein n=1 Tax=Globisporangium ultimum (strain ATCC 200006 / CBS 805.95 / DAOM BR144) TaxID=431595 RepID=K3WQC8_GLOUD